MQLGVEPIDVAGVWSAGAASPRAEATAAACSSQQRMMAS